MWCMIRVLLIHMQWNITWWRHQMETFPIYWPLVRGIHRSPVDSPHKGQWRGALMFSLICTWTNGNNRDASDLRRYRAHCDVTIMITHRICIYSKFIIQDLYVSELIRHNIFLQNTLSNIIKHLTTFHTVNTYSCVHQYQHCQANHIYRKTPKKTQKDLWRSNELSLHSFL